METNNFSNVMLHRYKEAYGLTSWYQVAKKLEVSESNVRKWRKGRNQMSWEMAFKMADLLQIPDQFVVLELLPHKIKNQRLINALEEMRTQ